MTTNASPVQYGHFRFCTEQVLWRPGLDRKQLRRRAALGCLVPDAVLYTVAGLIVILFSAVAGSVLSLAGVAGVALLVVAGLMAHRDYHRFGHDLSAQSATGRTDRGRGEWFIRASDFADRDLTGACTAARIIDAVHRSHAGPGASWPDAANLDTLHKLAWDTLIQLYATPSAHADFQPVATRLDFIAAQMSEINRQLHLDAAETATGELLHRVTAIHEVLAAEATR